MEALPDTERRRLLTGKAGTSHLSLLDRLDRAALLVEPDVTPDALLERLRAQGLPA